MALPAEARSKKEDPDEASWGFVEELLAQVIEEVSVLAADRRRKEPRDVPRPGVTAATPSSTGAGDEPQTFTGIGAMIDMAVARMGGQPPGHGGTP